MGIGQTSTAGRRWNAPGANAKCGVSQPMESGGACNRLDARLLVEELRSKVRTIGPHDCMQLRIKAERSERFGIPKRFEHFAPELALEIDLSTRAVFEGDENSVSAGVQGFG